MLSIAGRGGKTVSGVIGTHPPHIQKAADREKVIPVEEMFLDVGAIHQSRGGVLTGIVSVPCRYIHSPFSTCLLSDFDHTWRLLAAFCRTAPGV
jgi:endoglucanase